MSAQLGNSGSYFVYGGGGHAKVVVDAWLSQGNRLDGVVDDDARTGERLILGVPVEYAGRLEIPAHAYVHIAVGDNQARERVAMKLVARGLQLLTIVHPGALIAPSAQVGIASFVGAGAVIAPSALLGQGVIVNHSAVVDHDCVLGDWVHVAPNSTLGGAARVGSHVLVGAGAVVLPGVAVGDGAIIGAGAVVTADVTAGSVVVGIPARLRNGT